MLAMDHGLRTAGALAKRLQTRMTARPGPAQTYPTPVWLAPGATLETPTDTWSMEWTVLGRRDTTMSAGQRGACRSRCVYAYMHVLQYEGSQVEDELVGEPDDCLHRGVNQPIAGYSWSRWNMDDRTGIKEPSVRMAQFSAGFVEWTIASILMFLRCACRVQTHVLTLIRYRKLLSCKPADLRTTTHH